MYFVYAVNLDKKEYVVYPASSVVAAISRDALLSDALRLLLYSEWANCRVKIDDKEPKGYKDISNALPQLGKYIKYLLRHLMMVNAATRSFVNDKGTWIKDRYGERYYIPLSMLYLCEQGVIEEPFEQPKMKLRVGIWAKNRCFIPKKDWDQYKCWTNLEVPA